MAEKSFEEKTEKATPRKRKEAREKGEVARSKELPSVSVLIAALLTMTVFGSMMFTQVQGMMKGLFLKSAAMNNSLAGILVMGEQVIHQYILILLPILLAVFVAAVFSNALQVGIHISAESIKPKLTKLDPIKGLGRLFSKQSIMELINTLMKLLIVGGVAYLTVKGEFGKVMFLGSTEPKAIFNMSSLMIFKIFIRCTLAMIFLVAIDYAFRKWDFEKRIRMTKKEVKDDFKKTEGDPLIKSRIRSIQIEMAKRRMMQEVPKADMVITNPTHLAVAIKYDAGIMSAPTVMAKGAGIIAKKIKDVAEEHSIPVLENKELARNLYAAVNIGEEVPPILYQAVAEVLAYVYSLKGKYS